MYLYPTTFIYLQVEAFDRKYELINYYVCYSLQNVCDVHRLMFHQ